MKKFLVLGVGLIMLIGIVGYIAMRGDPESYYAIKIHRSAVVDKTAFRRALHKADWRRDMKFRQAEGDDDVPIPDDPADDDQPIGEIKNTRTSVAGYSPQGDWGAQVTQRAGFKSLQDLRDLLSQVTPTPTPSP
ncbi:MAG: hypothetical protein ABIU29_11045 [Chthoniobacterales bacterium]